MKAGEYNEMKMLVKRFSAFEMNELIAVAQEKVNWYNNRFLGVLHHQLQDVEDELFEAGYTFDEAIRHPRYINAYDRYIWGKQQYRTYQSQLNALNRLQALKRKHEDQKKLFKMRLDNESELSNKTDGVQLKLI